MFGFLRNLANPLKRYDRLATMSKVEKDAYKYLASSNHSGDQTDVILVQTVERFCYYALFGLIVKSMRKHKAIHVEQFVLSSIQENESTSLKQFLKLRFVGKARTKKWIKLYSAFCNKVGYKSAGFSTPVKDMVDFILAWRCWVKIKSKKDLVGLRIKGVLVGDLINDTYMRFKPAPTVNLKKKYLIIIIWQAYRDVRRATKYFEEVKPSAYLTSYTTYIQHGVAVRVALLAGVKVFSLSNFQEFAKELSIDDWFQTQNPDFYAKDFSKLGSHESKLALAEEAMSARVSGKIDNATSYMKKSAYVHSDMILPSLSDAIVIFLHDFYDSPHVYRNMVFPDFWEWVCFTIDTLQSSGIEFYIKPHPNQVELSDRVVEDLKSKYASLNVLPKEVSNKQLVDAGMICAVTVYGTVANEMAYLGVPTIAAAQHPHISFDFCRTATCKTEYAKYLKSYDNLNLDQMTMRRQSLIFYYMHNLNFLPERKNLMEDVIKLHYISLEGDEFPESLLNSIMNSVYFDEFCQELSLI